MTLRAKMTGSNLMSTVRRSRALRAVSIAAVLAGPYACAEKAFSPSASSAGLVRLNLMADVSKQVNTATRTVEVRVGYGRPSGEYVPLTQQSTPVTVGASVQVAITVDLSPCLSDPLHGAATNACPLLITVWLKDAAGATLDSAAAGPVSATPGTLSTPLTVTVAAVATVAVTPGVDTLAPGATVQLAATPANAAGAPLSGRVVTWTSSAPSVASVTASGLVTAVAEGSAQITASSGGAHGSVAITVRVPVASVSVAPAPVLVGAGLAMQLSATAKDAAGNVLAGRAISWSTSNAAVATVSASGLVTGVAAGGPVVITAASEGRTGTATVNVTATATAIATLVSAAPPSGTTVPISDLSTIPVQIQVRLTSTVDATGQIFSGFVSGLPSTCYAYLITPPAVTLRANQPQVVALGPYKFASKTGLPATAADCPLPITVTAVAYEWTVPALFNTGANLTYNLTAASAPGASLFDGSYTGTWNVTCPACGDASAGTFSTSLAGGVFSNTVLTITSGTHGPLFTAGTVSASGVITGTGNAPSGACSSSASSYTGVVSITPGGASMSMAYSRNGSAGGCAAESGTISATRNP